MKEYEVFKFCDDINENVVFLKTTEDLYFLQEDIFNSINKEKNKNLNVLVDLFLRNGYSFNRYVLMMFNERGECKTFIINPREVSERIKNCIKNYIKLNANILYQSSLSEKEIEFIIK